VGERVRKNTEEALGYDAPALEWKASVGGGMQVYEKTQGLRHGKVRIRI
jgi:hypothetical protein